MRKTFVTLGVAGLLTGGALAGAAAAAPVAHAHPVAVTYCTPGHPTPGCVFYHA